MRFKRMLGTIAFSLDHSSHYIQYAFECFFFLYFLGCFRF